MQKTKRITARARPANAPKMLIVSGLKHNKFIIHIL
jgi:hypothetical protein